MKTEHTMCPDVLIAAIYDDNLRLMQGFVFAMNANQIRVTAIIKRIGAKWLTVSIANWLPGQLGRRIVGCLDTLNNCCQARLRL